MEINRILDAEPALAYRHHDYGWTALHVAVMSRKPEIVDLILSRSTVALDRDDLWDGSVNTRASFASDRFAHWAMRRSTALHYACLLGDMEIVEMLLCHGAKWTIPDLNNLLPEHYIDVSNGDDSKKEFNRLCAEETFKQLKQHEADEKLRRTQKLAEEEELERSKLEEEKKSKKSKEAKEAKQLKKLAEGEESERKKKLAEEELKLEQRKRQSTLFPFQRQLHLSSFFWPDRCYRETYRR
jgi:ATP-dependent Clp protease ATP-binding subunit ClpB